MLRPDRRAPPRDVEPRGAPADRRRRPRADDRRVPAAHRRARAARRRRGERAPPAARRSSCSRRPARSSRWPTGRRSTRTPSTRADVAARRNRAIQDLYEPGSTFKVVTASAALEEGVITPTDLIDCAPGLHHVRQPRSIRDVHRYGALPFTDVIVKSSNVGAIKVGLQLGPRAPRPLRQPLRLRPDARAGLPRRERRHRLEPGAARSERAGVGVDGLPGRRHAAADGRGRERGRQRRRAGRAARRARVHPRTAAATRCRRKVLRRAITAETAATLTDDHGSGRRARHRAKRAQIEGYTVAGKTGTAAKLVNGRYSKSDYNASFVGFVPSRKPALTIIVVIDSPHAQRLLRRHRRGADLQAHRRSGAAASRRRPDAERAAAGARRAARLAAATA